MFLDTLDLVLVSKSFLSIFNTYFVTTIAFVLYFFSKDKKCYKEMICLMFLTMLYNSILKGIFKLPLPETCHANCYSFPSGHMNFQSVFYIWLILFNKNNLMRLGLICFWWISGAAMVFAGYHFARDIIITPLFSIFFIMSSIKISKKIKEEMMDIVFVGFAFVFMITNYFMISNLQYHVSLAFQLVYGLIFFRHVFQKEKISNIVKLSFMIFGCAFLVLVWNKYCDLQKSLLELRFFAICGGIEWLKTLYRKANNY